MLKKGRSGNQIDVFVQQHLIMFQGQKQSDTKQTLGFTNTIQAQQNLNKNQTTRTCRDYLYYKLLHDPFECVHYVFVVFVFSLSLVYKLEFYIVECKTNLVTSVKHFQMSVMSLNSDIMQIK